MSDSVQFASNASVYLFPGLFERKNYCLTFRVSVVVLAPESVANVVVVGLCEQIYYKDHTIFLDGLPLTSTKINPAEFAMSFFYGGDAKIMYAINNDIRGEIAVRSLPYSGIVRFGALNFSVDRREEANAQNIIRCGDISVF